MLQKIVKLGLKENKKIQQILEDAFVSGLEIQKVVIGKLWEWN